MNRLKPIIKYIANSVAFISLAQIFELLIRKIGNSHVTLREGHSPLAKKFKVIRKLAV